MTRYFSIVVCTAVLGNSRGPKGFDRVKPLPYADPKRRHAVVYAQNFEISDSPKPYDDNLTMPYEAYEFMEIADRVYNEMIRLYSRATVDGWKIFYWNIERDRPQGFNQQVRREIERSGWTGPIAYYKNSAEARRDKRDKSHANEKVLDLSKDGYDEAYGQKMSNYLLQDWGIL